MTAMKPNTPVKSDPLVTSHLQTHIIKVRDAILTRDSDEHLGTNLCIFIWKEGELTISQIQKRRQELNETRTCGDQKPNQWTITP
ncbi:hypothetical protein E2C01_014563 [Portunus trituberculatus]|uniref:Uncharacterized protein n=1 Tax=Portunus trituberculatus TaxID=210409 RepID=A0A5B7DKA1_PORTR|nr:hypothetical protein [Portunus trituberculatus]